MATATQQAFAASLQIQVAIVEKFRAHLRGRYKVELTMDQAFTLWMHHHCERTPDGRGFNPTRFREKYTRNPCKYQQLYLHA